MMNQELLMSPNHLVTFLQKPAAEFTKADIINSCPDISPTTVEKVLGEMRRENSIKTVGSGRGTKWCKTDQL